MPANSEIYQQKAVVLDGGLDLVTPRLLVEPGKVVDCLNYECVDQVGYKKIDGFERYDGGPSPSQVNFWGISTTVSSMSSLGGFAEGEKVQLEYTDSYGHNRVLSVTCRSVTTFNGKWWLYFYPPYIESLEGASACTMTCPALGGTATALTVDDVIVISKTSLVSSALSEADDVRDTIWALPQDNFPYGMQYHKNSLYVVANCRYMYLALDPSLYGAPPSVTARTFFVGNKYSIGGVTGTILDWKFLRGGFDGVGTSGATRAWVKVLVYPDAATTPTNNTTCNIDRTNNVYTTGNVTCWKYYAAIDVDGPTDSEEVWGGVIYKSLEDGTARDSNTNTWEQKDLGLEVYFKNGSSTITPKELTLYTTEAQLANELQSVSSSPPNDDPTAYTNIELAYTGNATNWNTVAWNGQTDGQQSPLNSPGTFSLSSDDDTGVYARQSGNWGDGTGIKFSGFDFNIPSDVIITGITLSAKCFHQEVAAMGDPYFNRIQLTLAGSANKAQGTSLVVSSTNPAAPNSFTFGGENDLWGLSGVTPDQLNDADFGVWMTPQLMDTTGVQYLFWDTLVVTVHYYRPVGKAYFYDGSGEVEAKLVRIHLRKGSWSGADAEGVMHVYDVVDDGSRNYIKVGDNIRIVSGGANIGEVTAVKASLLPSHSELVASDRRFQTISANYFLNDDWDTIYGCHGLGPAFSYDDRYFRKIYTAYTPELDKPSHIASYRNYLALGYSSGNVLLSRYGDSGPEPENFDPIQGAREFSFVDGVTGLKELADTSLGVFCRQSINRIVLNTTATDSASLFYTAVISPNTGAIEYTVTSFGNLTLLCDQYGIRSVEQTDVYGDFVGRPVSYPVSPWLRPRLSAKKYWSDSKIAQKPLFAHACRAKNQYRVWFDDGYVLTMNMNTTEEAPKFMLSRYAFDWGTSTVPLTPICDTAVLDKEGTERLFVGHWNRASTSDGYENNPALFKYCYELERGWSFDGQDFPVRITINLSFLQTPFDNDIIRKVELHALDYNNTNLWCNFGTKYTDETLYDNLSMGDVYVAAGRDAAGSVSTDYIPFSKMMSVASRGRPLFMKLKNSTLSTDGLGDSWIQPPHILQALLVQFIPAKTEI